MIDDRIKAQLRRIVGPENFLESDLDRFGYSYDASFVPLNLKHLPDVVVRPATTQEVSLIMKIAQDNSLPVTPRGAASGRTGGSIPLAHGISLSLDRMQKILELDEENMMVTVEAGVRTAEVYNFCAARGLFYPPDPASSKFSTIGGNIAENAGGIRAVKYGVTKNYVMGLEVVLADGSIIHTGGKAIKNVTGYDLTSLFVGSEGTLGIITKAILRLLPLPKRQHTIQITFRNLHESCLMVYEMLRSSIIPTAAELMDSVSLKAVLAHRNMDLEPGVEACLIVEIDGNEEEEMRRQTEGISQLAHSHEALSFKVAQNEEEAEKIWSLRRGVSSALAALAPDRIGEDISVPRAAFPEAVLRIREIAMKYNLTIAVYGHAGDGNLHPSILGDLSDPAVSRRIHGAIEEIFDVALSLGGTLSGEHGIGITKKPFFRKAVGEKGEAIHRAIKEALDPKGILNPGKIW